jgi:hypothetical protein
MNDIRVQSGRLVRQAAPGTTGAQLPAAHSWVEEVPAIASGLEAMTLVAIASVLAVAAFRIRAGYMSLLKRLDRLEGDIAPILRDAGAIAVNMNQVTTVLRDDVGQIHSTITKANERVQQAVAITEERLNDFNALLEVVQDEAEQLFISTAAAVRGVRTGAASFGRDDGPELASTAPSDDTAGSPDSADDIDDDVEDTDGDDDLADGDPGPHREPTLAPPAPRLRPRPKQRRWS